MYAKCLLLCLPHKICKKYLSIIERKYNVNIIKREWILALDFLGSFLCYVLGVGPWAKYSFFFPVFALRESGELPFLQGLN